jgi:hypothetical protein
MEVKIAGKIIYPLVNLYITNWKITIAGGKIHALNDYFQ